METYDKITKDTISESAYSIAKHLLETKQPFSLAIWTEENWNKPLPAVIKERFPTQMVLTIKQLTLDESFVTKEGDIVINTILDGDEFTLDLDKKSIISVLDDTNNPIVLCNFYNEDEPEEMENSLGNILPSSKEEIIEMIKVEGIPEENVKKSLDVFLNGNLNIKYIVDNS